MFSYTIEHTPFKHVTGKAQEEILNMCKVVYNGCCETDPKQTEVPIKGLIQANQGCEFTAHNDTFNDTLANLIFRLPKFLNKIRLEIFPEITSSGSWSIATNESYMGSTESGILYPHTDNPEELVRHGVDPHNIGHLKFLLYIADDNNDYTDYGTKLYVPTGKEFPNDFVQAKEIPFKNGNFFLWKPGPDTYHGTSFTQHNHRRFFICGEYTI